MKNSDAWEQEYKKGSLVTLSYEPQVSVKDFIRWIRRDQGFNLENCSLIDIGCGNGKNSFYAIEHGIQSCFGFDISKTAISYAQAEQERRGIPSPQLTFKIDTCIPSPKLPYKDASFDIALDVTTTNSLTTPERTAFLNELYRILKPEARILVRTLSKDGDEHAKKLLTLSPGPEKDMYILPETRHAERVFSKKDLEATYLEAGFTCVHLDSETHYTKVHDRRYKRKYWVAYFAKNPLHTPINKLM
jgi:SAM-dependent methyltransferase